MPIDTSDIAYQFGLSEEALITESVRQFLTEHIRTLESDRQARCAKLGVNTLEEMADLLRRGAVSEEAIGEDLEEANYLTHRIQKVRTLLDELPPPPRDPLPTLDEIRQTLKAQMPALKEKHNVNILGIFGPYATGHARPYDCVGLLVEFDKTPGWAFVGLQRELGDILGIEVELSTGESMWPGSVERIMSELVEF